MSLDQQNQLQETKASFYKLQHNFNHNLKVITQLQSQNERLIEQNDAIHLQYQQEIDQLQSTIQQLQQANQKIYTDMNKKIENLRKEADDQMENVVRMMNQKIMEQRKIDSVKAGQEKKDMQNCLDKLEDTVNYYSLENSKLIETVKQLRTQKELLEAELDGLIAQKETYANKFSLHQKELENLRTANEQWEAILKDKIKQANKDKQKAEEQLSEAKLSFKLKLKALKEEASKKLEEMDQAKEKSIRLLTQQARQIKFRFDSNFQELQKLKVQAKNSQKERQKAQQLIEQLSKQAGSQKQMEYLKKMHEQEKLQLKNQIKLIENQRNQIKDELKETNERREEVEKACERLKSGFMSAQKEVGDWEKRNKKLEREVKDLRNQIKRISEAANINYRVLAKPENQDYIQENPIAQNQQNMDYSKYFSQDMGPGDEMFFLENSIPKSTRSPKNNQPPAGPSQVNHQLMKKIGQLQVQTDQYKNVIKTMTQQMQRIKTHLTDQMSNKQQEIKLARDEVYLLREKINERQQQLLSLSSLRQQVDDKNRKINEFTQKINNLVAELQVKDGLVKKLERELSDAKRVLEETEEKLVDAEQERRILDEINEELRGEIHHFKNRIQAFNQSDQEDGQSDEFQEIRYENNISNISENIKRKNPRKNSKSRSGSRSKSKSGKKNKAQIGHRAQPSTTSMKLRDLVARKKQFQMEGKKMNLDYRELNPNKQIEKNGTQSQKEVFQNLRRRSKEKEGERFRASNSNRLRREVSEAQRE